MTTTWLLAVSMPQVVCGTPVTESMLFLALVSAAKLCLTVRATRPWDRTTLAAAESSTVTTAVVPSR